MKNYYINRLKNVSTNFFNETSALRREQERNKAMYSEKIAEEKNQLIEQEISEKHKASRKVVYDTFDRVRRGLGRESFPKIEELAPERLFLSADSPLKLSENEVRSMILYYQNNPTMSRLLFDFATKNYPYLTAEIVLPSDKLQVYKEFCEGSLSLLEKTICGKADSTLIEGFADEDFCGDLLEKIGTGGDIDTNLENSSIPQNTETTFENVLINEHNGR